MDRQLADMGQIGIYASVMMGVMAVKLRRLLGDRDVPWRYRREFNLLRAGELNVNSGLGMSNGVGLEDHECHVLCAIASYSPRTVL
jgi:hypothetical protein